MNADKALLGETLTGDVGKYTKLDVVGEGTYGKVWKATVKGETEEDNSQKFVALKRVKVTGSFMKDPKAKNLGLPLPYIREMKLLSECEHENVISLIEIVTSKKSHSTFDQTNLSLYFVFEYLPFDLKGLLTTKYPFTPLHIEILFKQLIQAVKYLHDRQICHRDLKTANILVGKDFKLKLTDFGLARKLDEDQNPMLKGQPAKYTNNVVTIWYKSPQLLLGDRRYSFEIDIWSLGCIFFEMHSLHPMFPGSTEIEMLHRIFKMLGYPKDEKIFRKMPNQILVKKSRFTKYPSQLAQTTSKDNFSPNNLKIEGASLDLLQKMLIFDKRERITAAQMDQHEYFDVVNEKYYHNPGLLGEIKIEGDIHELEARNAKLHAAKELAEQEQAKSQTETAEKQKQAVFEATKVEESKKSVSSLSDKSASHTPDVTKRRSEVSDDNHRSKRVRYEAEKNVHVSGHKRDTEGERDRQVSPRKYRRVDESITSGRRDRDGSVSPRERTRYRDNRHHLQSRSRDGDRRYLPRDSNPRYVDSQRKNAPFNGRRSQEPQWRNTDDRRGRAKSTSNYHNPRQERNNHFSQHHTRDPRVFVRNSKDRSPIYHHQQPRYAGDNSRKNTHRKQDTSPSRPRARTTDSPMKARVPISYKDNYNNKAIYPHTRGPSVN